MSETFRVLTKSMHCINYSNVFQIRKSRVSKKEAYYSLRDADAECRGIIKINWYEVSGILQCEHISWSDKWFKNKSLFKSLTSLRSGAWIMDSNLFPSIPWGGTDLAGNILLSSSRLKTPRDWMFLNVGDQLFHCWMAEGTNEGFIRSSHSNMWS